MAARSFLVTAAMFIGLALFAVGVADAQKASGFEFVGFASFKRTRCMADSYETISDIGSEKGCFKKCKKDRGCDAVSYNKKSKICQLFDNQCKDSFRKASRNWSTSVRDMDGWVKMGHSGLHCAFRITSAKVLKRALMDPNMSSSWEQDCRVACSGTTGCGAIAVIDETNYQSDGTHSFSPIPQIYCYLLKNCKVLASSEDGESRYRVSAAKTRTRVQEKPGPPT